MSFNVSSASSIFNASWSNHPHTNSSMQDVTHLMYLETIKRFKDAETDICRQAEKKAFQRLQSEAEYRELYKKYTALVKLEATHWNLVQLQGLEQNNYLNVSNIDKAVENAVSIVQKISSDNLTEFLNTDALAQSKENLSLCKNHDKLFELQRKLSELKASVKAIQMSIETTKLALESAITQELEFYVNETQPIFN